MTVRSISSLPDLPVVSLHTAQITNTIDAFRGRNTVIDFWTTTCTRCPDALDKLDEMAKDVRYENIHFVSICCDKLDGAREILEQQDDLRWNHLQHYFMESQHKEQAKQILGFKSVPFYVMMNEDGEITQKGSKVDFDDVPGVVRRDDGKENVVPLISLQVKKLVSSEPQQERLFELDDLDF